MHSYGQNEAGGVKGTQGSGFAVLSYHEAGMERITKSKYYFYQTGNTLGLWCLESLSFLYVAFLLSFLAPWHS